ncbi:MAG: hypothetical protein H0T05_01315 [Acidobacteria bacterium]|nr:hypothetical protein [Acidobacteriota bacterium]MBA3884125.1 hypothetical protein [Acidobacteriota bacterium]
MFAFRTSHAPHSHADPAVALASGFLGTLAMTSIMYVVPALGIGQVDLPIWVARLFVNQAAQAAAIGLALHVLLGSVYALLYAFQIEPRLQVRPAAGGLIFGAGLWVFAQALAVPLLGGWTGPTGALDGPGFLALNLGGSAAAASLAAHLAYGATVAIAYGCHDGAACRERRPPASSNGRLAA